MFSKSFNLSSILSRSKQQSRVSCVLEPNNNQNDQKQRQISRLREQLKQYQSIKQLNNQLRQQNDELKQQIQKLKQLFIETRIKHDNQIRASDQLLQQLKQQIEYKQSLIEEYLRSHKQQLVIKEIHQDDQLQEDNKPYYPQNSNHQRQFNRQYQNNLQKLKIKKVNSLQTKEISQLMIQSTISFQHKYQACLYQIQTLKQQCQRLRLQLHNTHQKVNANMLNTNDVSFTGKGESKISFDFGDITADLKDVQQIAQFSHGQSQITVLDEEQINVREQRIQNLQRQNFELQHQLASKSHKLARIFNAAHQFGGMQLLDYLQNSIGLVEEKEDTLQ